MFRLSEKEDCERVANNFRAIQPLNNRTVFMHSQKMRENLEQYSSADTLRFPNLLGTTLTYMFGYCIWYSYYIQNVGPNS